MNKSIETLTHSEMIQVLQKGTNNTARYSIKEMDEGNRDSEVSFLMKMDYLNISLKEIPRIFVKKYKQQYLCYAEYRVERAPEDIVYIPEFIIAENGEAYIDLSRRASCKKGAVFDAIKRIVSQMQESEKPKRVVSELQVLEGLVNKSRNK